MEQLFSGGDGSRCFPYLISTTSDLDNIRNYSDFHFRQINDIDMSDFDFDAIGEFGGTYDGCYYSIINLNAVYECMFFTTLAGSSIQRLRLVNSVDTKLANYVDGEIMYCSLEGKQHLKANRDGGFVYRVRSGGKILRSFFVNGFFKGGGFCYRADAGSVIEDCYVRKVHDINSFNASGFIENSYGEIYNCYADEVVINSHSFNSGGFVGIQDNIIASSFCSNVKIIHTYNGQNDNSYIGGFGYQVYGTISNVASINVSISSDSALYIGGFTARLVGGNADNFYIDVTLPKKAGTATIDDVVASPEENYTITPFAMNDKWSISPNIFNEKPHIRRFWEGTELPLEENPWAIKEGVNDGMPFLKRLPSKSVVYSKTENGWDCVEQLLVKSSDGGGWIECSLLGKNENPKWI